MDYFKLADLSIGLVAAALLVKFILDFVIKWKRGNGNCPPKPYYSITESEIRTALTAVQGNKENTTRLLDLNSKMVELLSKQAYTQETLVVKQPRHVAWTARSGPQTPS